MKNSKFTFWFLLLALPLIAGCGSHLYLVRDLNASYTEKGWSFEIDNIEDNLRTYIYKFGNQETVYSPIPETNRFIRMDISITNGKENNATFNFNYLKLGDNDSIRIAPTMIWHETFVANIPANPNPELSGNENISRTVIYSVPPDFHPNKIIFESIGELLDFNKK